MKYNSIANAEQFITDQISWCKTNGYENFTIWSNGKELSAKIDSDDVENRMQNIDFEREGFWKVIIFRNGYRVEF